MFLFQATLWQFFTDTLFMAKMQSCNIYSLCYVALELEFLITVRNVIFLISMK